MHAVIVQQGRLGDRSFGAGATLVALFERFGGDFLERFEAMAVAALVLVKWHVWLLSY